MRGMIASALHTADGKAVVELSIQGLGFSKGCCSDIFYQPTGFKMFEIAIFDLKCVKNVTGLESGAEGD